MKHYRIIRRWYATGFLCVIQRWRWYFPFWMDIPSGALHMTLKEAERNIEAGCPNKYREYQKEKEAERLANDRKKKQIQVLKFVDQP